MLLRYFVTYSFSCFLLSALVYIILAAIMPGGYVFGAGFRMFLYHWQYPFQYIAVVSFFYGLTAAVWGVYFSDYQGVRRVASIVTVMLFTILLSSAPGGVLWKIHDMYAGYFPSDARLWMDLLWGAKKGLSEGWIIILISVPYNVIGVLLGYVVTDKVPSLISRAR